MVLLITMSTDEKFEELKRLITASVDSLQRSQEDQRKSQDEHQRNMDDKLKKLERDLEASRDDHEDAAERALKRARKDRPLVFNKKGHEEQFNFNLQVQDNLTAATRRLDKLQASDKDKQIIDKAKEELEEGAAALADRQKMIRLADTSENGWGAVAEYKGYDFADSQEDNTRMGSCDRSAGVKKRRMASAQRGSKKRFRQPHQSWGQNFMYPQMLPPAPNNYPQPHFTPQPAPIRPRGMPGPCFQCGEMGHLRASCPKLQRPYPCNRNDYVWHADSACQGNSAVCVNIGVATVKGGGEGHAKTNMGMARNISPKVLGSDNVCDARDLESGLVSEGQDTIAVNNSSKRMRSPIQEAINGDNLSMEGQKSVNHTFNSNCKTQATSSLDHQEGTVSDDFSGSLELTRCWEIEGDSQVEDVQGRLKENISFWEQNLEPAPWILDCIKEGYKLPLKTIPGPFLGKNQDSALNHREFVTEALRELELNRCIKKVDEQPHICSPLSVVDNGRGKYRLVINLRYLNQFLWKDKFKYEDLRTAMLMFKQGDFVFSFDLKSGYHHVDIYGPHRNYLGFQWNTVGGSQFFVFTVLPFGLATACYAFTKLLRPLVKYWRKQGLRAIVYLDDGIIAVSGKQAAIETSARVRQDLANAGLVDNMAKSSWLPSQKICWLGFNLDLEVGQIAVPQEKVVALRSLLLSATSAKEIKAKALASIIGKIVSMSLGLGLVTRLMTRRLYSLLNSRHYWCESLIIPSDAREELKFWSNNLDNFNGQGIWHSPSAVRVVYSDASDIGYGGYSVEHGYHMAQGLWTQEEAARSSTWRELRAVRMVLESLIEKLRNERVRWFSDNQNVVRILQTGSRKPDLQSEALAIFSLTLQGQVRIDPEWVPRTLNQQADWLSRIDDHDDWALHPNHFRVIDKMWGPHTVDRFACYYNAHLQRFNSRFWNPGSEAVDAFTCNWSGEVNWMCPPPYLIPRTIKHALNTMACGTLIVPKWPSAPFWPMLYPAADQMAPFVTDVKVLQKDELVLIPGRSGSNLFNGAPNTDMLAIKIVPLGSGLANRS